MYMVAGSQADSAGGNTITVVRLTQLTKTRKDGDDSDDSDDSDADGDADGGPVLQSRVLAHHGCVRRVRGVRAQPPAAALGRLTPPVRSRGRGVNRIRAQPQAPHVVATWAETGHVQVWDVKPQLLALNGETAAAGAAPKLARVPPRQVFTGHQTEGYAMDWSPVVAGRLLSGDCSGAVHLWEPADGGRRVSCAMLSSPLAHAARMRRACRRRQRRHARLTSAPPPSHCAGGRLAAPCFPATAAHPLKTCSGAPTRRAYSPLAAWMVRTGARMQGPRAAAAARAHVRASCGRQGERARPVACGRNG
jgi:hypothetical protein